MNYFQQLIQILKIEREEDRKTYANYSESTSVTLRRTNGQAWYPIAIKGIEVGTGDYLIIEIERTSHHDILHQFRFGVSVALFSNLNPLNNRIVGNVSHINGNRLKITLRNDDLPDWTRDGKLGIDLLFDEYSYDEMQKALHQASKLLDHNKHNELIKVLLGEKSPEFETYKSFPVSDELNHDQQLAVYKIMSAQELAIIHGPPGTGKTTTLIQAIKKLLTEQKQLLVLAPSNAAVDLLTEKLFAEKLNVTRIGNPVRISQKLMDLTLDNKIMQHPQVKDIRKMKKQANQFRDMAHKYKRNFGKAEKEQRKALMSEAHQLMKEVDKREQMITNDVLNKTQIITATLIGANHYSIRDRSFETVIIDEAGQALEPACWISILKANKLIFAGDHLQLPPTIKSDEAIAKGLGRTLLEKCVENHPLAVITLKEQYRMHTAIMKFPSITFYRDSLFAHPSVANTLLFDNDEPIQFIDTVGCGFEEKNIDTSINNPEEASFLIQHLIQLCSTLEFFYTLDAFPSIAIISPYMQQIGTIKELYLQSSLTKFDNKIAINTIDSFQGQERDIVIISMTRSNTDHKIGFLSDIRRMNVAMTRAKRKLTVIGDSITLSTLPFYRNFIEHVENVNGYHSAWEFIKQ